MMTLPSSKAMTADLKHLIAEVIEKPELEYVLDMEQAIEEYGIDSMKIIRLIVLIESRFNIAFADEELVLDNFSTLQSIADKVLAKCGVHS
ncbi:acyl carrier protein [Paenibacillus hexagrammi]|uniref:Acyl carrier protein n=1 Tax=Paenibacillus hexagrammi TaxID=2908839 RepID=A0ABY3SFL2_9BACL|nr:acyl carrier protein [Paenibacillus sp. YPD9-1]UJF31870.1 acyl carrier protein [Paenibacillus sp. YPD9-1]